MEYTISQAAQKVGLTTHTLRYYDKEGILLNVKRNSSGIRIFTEDDFAWLKILNCLKTSGLTIKQIKEYISLFTQGDATLEQRRQLFYSRKKEIENQMEQLKKTLCAINYKCWFYDTAVSAGSESAPKNIKEDDLPPEIIKLKKESGLFED